MNDMKTPVAQLVALALAGLAPIAPATAQSLAAIEQRAAEADTLLAELSNPDLRTWEATENKIIGIWSRSGSDTADLLLDRGQKAIEDRDFDTAIEHLTALTDHAPDFAEGWHSRATAFFLAGEYGLALADLERTLALNPRHFVALTGLGIVLEELGDNELALAAMRHAYDLNPHRDSITSAIRRLEQALGESTL